jgi:sortase B
MERKAMFGAISDFSQREFFDEHRYGNLFANDTDYGLEFFCFLDADAYDRSIYRHTFADDGEREDYLKLLHERARNWRTGVEVGKDDHIVLLSTCSSGYTNAREILVGKICNERFKNPFVKIPNLGSGVDTQEGWLGVPYWCWLALAVLAVLCVIIVRARKAKRVVE